MQNKSTVNLKRRMSSLGKMRRLGNLKPDYDFGFRMPGDSSDSFMEILKFKKVWPAIIFLFVFAGGFSIPLFTLNPGLGNIEDLFDLTFSLFTLFWALGWSVGVLIIVLILLALLFAREVVIVEPDRIRLRIEIFRIGLESSNQLARICNLRYVASSTEAGLKWRDGHLALDYLHVPVSFGSRLGQEDAARLMQKINATLTHPIPEKLSAAMENRLQHIDQAPEAASPLNQDAPEPVSTSRTSLWLLLLANLVPLGGVFLFGWTVGDVMLLFWLESAIIGFFNVLKMFAIAGAIAVFYSLFFIAHFGAFMAVHLMFLFGLFIDPDGAISSLADVAATFGNLWIAILALFVSHGFSYYENFLGKQEYKRLSISKQMHKPYSRIITMHITLIMGGFLVLALDAPILALTLLVLMKVIVDTGAHIKEHKSP